MKASPFSRTNPDVGKIYVLIKAKDNEAAMKRLKNEDIHGKNYHSFVLSKQVLVVGNFTKAYIGIAPEYDVALDINTMGPYRIMSFAQRFRRLKLFLQVSTAYVNGQRQGLILEKPFCLGDTITKGIGSSDFSAHQNTMLDIEAEIKLAFDSRRHSSASASVTQEMKEAKPYGWQDMYVFTKAMGEMVINCMRGEIPVVTIRPSVIESTWRDPFPGWMEGNRI
nr:fatty acyl-CoA reductase 2, chloroplastic-like [Aegilops tauschii subsp. strangulata]